MNVLLVEDDSYNRTYLASFLRRMNHCVDESDNGYHALELFQTGTYHMVLSDIRMPGMSGIELLYKLTGLPGGNNAAVVLFTGYGGIDTAVEALKAGAYDYLLKPINIKELAVVIERVAEHQSLLRENKVLTTNFKDMVQAATEETRRELSRLKRAFARVVGLGEIGIFSDKMKNIFEQASRYHADSSIPVLILGETGTGKEVVARYIHYGHTEAAAPFVDVNCAALAPNVFESELFGYEAGSFTGGLAGGKKGKLDLAAGGTLFLDEIAELTVEFQAKLLRVIQEREFYRVGGLKKINADMRIICATNCKLEERIREGSFRQDLYYRLNVGYILLPPLRERTEEILPLADMFLRESSHKRKKHFARISQEAAGPLMSYHWPGNIRELRNAMEYVTFFYDDIELKRSHLQCLHQFKEDSFPGLGRQEPEAADAAGMSLPPDGFNLDRHIDQVVLTALDMHNGNKAKTARYLGITRRALYCRLKRMGENSC